jgi:hypothetical protein
MPLRGCGVAKLREDQAGEVDEPAVAPRIGASWVPCVPACDKGRHGVLGKGRVVVDGSLHHVDLLILARHIGTGQLVEKP